MEQIKSIMPEVIGQIAMANVEFIKRKALQYADTLLSGGDMPAEYKSDYDNGLYNNEQACAVVWLADVYIALKQGLYTRGEALEKQREILHNLLSVQNHNSSD